MPGLTRYSCARTVGFLDNAPLVDLVDVTAHRGGKVYPNLIIKWKRQAAEGIVHVFSGKAGRRDGALEAEIKELHAKIGELTVERDFLSKAFGR